MIAAHDWPRVLELRHHPQLAALAMLDAALHLADHALAAAHPSVQFGPACCAEPPSSEFDLDALHLVSLIQTLRSQIDRYCRLAAFIRFASRSTHHTGSHQPDHDSDDHDPVGDEDIPSVPVIAAAGIPQDVLLTPPATADGVLRAVVYDETDVPRAERLAFRKATRPLDVQVVPQSSEGDLQLAVRVTSGDGTPVRALLVASVLDAERRPGLLTIPAAVLLANEVRGAARCRSMPHSERGRFAKLGSAARRAELAALCILSTRRVCTRGGMRRDAGPRRMAPSG